MTSVILIKSIIDQINNKFNTHDFINKSDNNSRILISLINQVDIKHITKKFDIEHVKTVFNFNYVPRNLIS